ncbi:MAG: hypothetical protein LBS03_09840 [Bacteroidales bacterium]|jgi:hypothetical protein|nr:hypothetical protein [Bacteroidales bacterium]
MGSSYLPRKDRELLVWTVNFLKHLFPSLARFTFPYDEFAQKRETAEEPATRTKPADMGELIHSTFDTHTPLILTFKESERGKTLWFSARRENACGEKGHWGEIQSVIIP